MAGVITLDPSNAGLYNIVLNGATFFIRTYWNQYANRWFMDFNDVDDNPIASGLAIVSRVNLFQSRPELSLTIGEIWPVDLKGGDCETRDQLGITVQLIYFLPGEFEATFPNFNDQLFRPLNYIFDDLFTVV
jgi:hypothetical protein